MVTASACAARCLFFSKASLAIVSSSVNSLTLYINIYIYTAAQIHTYIQTIRHINVLTLRRALPFFLEGVHGNRQFVGQQPVIIYISIYTYTYIYIYILLYIGSTYRHICSSYKAWSQPHLAPRAAFLSRRHPWQTLVLLSTACYCLFIYLHIPIGVLICTCIPISIYISIHLSICIYIYLSIYLYLNLHIYIHIHA